MKKPQGKIRARKLWLRWLHPALIEADAGSRLCRYWCWKPRATRGTEPWKAPLSAGPFMLLEWILNQEDFLVLLSSSSSSEKLNTKVPETEHAEFNLSIQVTSVAERGRDSRHWEEEKRSLGRGTGWKAASRLCKSWKLPSEPSLEQV